SAAPTLWHGVAAPKDKTFAVMGAARSKIRALKHRGAALLFAAGEMLKNQSSDSWETEGAPTNNMWPTVLPPIFRPSMFWIPERQAPSAWIEHVPFGFWLVDVLRPRRIVELGTYNGVSYSAMCQAVKTLGLATSCFAVDSWKGDEHAGFYGEDVYEDF